MPRFNGKSLFIDTNALDALRQDQFARLMQAAQRGDIQIVLSKAVVWEYAKHRHRAPNEQSQHGARAVLSDLQKGGLLFGTLYQIKTAFEAVNIRILDLPAPENVARLLAAEEYYFRGARRHLKDANIALTAIEQLDPRTTIVICGERNTRLSQVFRANDFPVKDSLMSLRLGLSKGSRRQVHQFPNMDQVLAEREFLQVDDDLMALLREVEPESARLLPSPNAVIIPAAQLPELPTTRDELNSKLTALGQTDDNIRIKLLGNAYAFQPAPKDVVIAKARLEGTNSDSVVLTNLERLVNEGLLVESGDYILPNAANPESLQIGAQAMVAILDDVLETGSLDG